MFNKGPGFFYLGRMLDFDSNSEEAENGDLLYESKHLATHAICIGTAESDKTGLCFTLLTEAATVGIPAIAIDSKGELSNLLFTFTERSADGFLPSIHDDERRSERDDGKLWDDRMREETGLTFYTPGSTAGQSVSIKEIFKRPPESVLNDSERLADQINGLTAGLLGLIGLPFNSLHSREYVLLSNVLLYGWQKGLDINLSVLIQLIQNPPFEQIGAMPVDLFYPQEERFALALKFNHFLASPRLDIWREGEPLDVDRLLYTETGKPRVSVLSMAHLTESERMFLVSFILNQLVCWMQNQPKTTGLHALICMDEVCGCLENPPSNKPLLNLLHQAHAYGLGLILTAQKPSNLDYKGLSSVGTWLIGQLQTEYDKELLLESLEKMAVIKGTTFNRARMAQLITNHGHRVFLLYSVYQDEPVLFETGWHPSYPADSMVHSQLQQNKSPLPKESEGFPGLKPKLPQGVQVVFAPTRESGDSITYRPFVIGWLQIGYHDLKNNISHNEEKIVFTAISQNVFPVNWDESSELTLELDAFEKDGVAGIPYADLPRAAQKASHYTTWKRDLIDWAYRTCRLSLLQVRGTDLISQPGETEVEFLQRIQPQLSKRHDQELEKLKQKYEIQKQAIEEKIQKSKQVVEREKEQAKQQKTQTAISFLATILSAFLGKKHLNASSLSRATTTARGASRTVKENSDIERSKETVEVYQEKLKALEESFHADIDALADRFDPIKQELETKMIRPYKKDIQARDLIFAWMPYRTCNLQSPAWPQ